MPIAGIVVCYDNVVQVGQVICTCICAKEAEGHLDGLSWRSTCSHLRQVVVCSFHSMDMAVMESVLCTRFI